MRRSCGNWARGGAWGSGPCDIAVRAVACGGARRIIAYATHGVFVDGSPAVIASAGLEQLVITNTVPVRKEMALDPKLVALSNAPLLATAIRRSHMKESMASLRTYGQAPSKERYMGQS